MEQGRTWRDYTVGALGQEKITGNAPIERGLNAVGNKERRSREKQISRYNSIQ